MNRIKKENYITEEIKQMELDLKQIIKNSKEELIVQKMIDKLSEERQLIMLDLLSRKFATKGEYK